MEVVAGLWSVTYFYGREQCAELLLSKMFGLNSSTRRIVAADLSARNFIGGRMAWPACKALIVGINYTGREVASLLKLPLLTGEVIGGSHGDSAGSHARLKGAVNDAWNMYTMLRLGACDGQTYLLGYTYIALLTNPDHIFLIKWQFEGMLIMPI